ncbi:GDSL esterase/lipase At3g53100-like isoform X4 [Camellia sinensis]|uniref:GDSL esterase/lipase At3g53100-like isoform X4 n=1 Tax=Camellia sinensis TaxID=4442 RepID=UPI0010359B70|nr:GDSL esterase/lipase At3g53100-like isoform X4 [Camellia sinensis]
MKKLATGINNNYLRLKGALFLIIALAFAINDGDAQNSTTLIPSILTFGDSAVDVGNNDHIHTIFKANFPPYGRDFINHKPTGRFCNGKLATDITDRTTNFAHCYPGFAVSMGVLYKEKPAIGAVVELVGGPMCQNTHTFSVAAGEGTFCNGQKDSSESYR